MVRENKKAWHTKLIHALWVDRISVKKSIGNSPFWLVYGLEVIFPNSLSLPIMILFQEEDTETHPTQRRMYQLVELQKKKPWNKNLQTCNLTGTTTTDRLHQHPGKQMA